MEIKFGKLITKINSEVEITKIIGEYLTLQSYGKDFRGLCPFHNDKNPSLLVSWKKQIFKCFSCNVGGTSVKFVMLYENLNFLDAVRKIVEKHQISLDFNFEKIPEKSPEEIELLEITKEIHIFYQSQIFVPPKFLAVYLNKRLLSRKIVEKYEIGWTGEMPKNKLWEYLKKKKYTDQQILQTKLFNLSVNDQYFDYFSHRLIFPLRNNKNELVGFSGRIIGKDNQSKFLVSRENLIFNKSEILFNLNYIQQKFKELKKIYLVEGFTDAIMMTEAGFPAIALLGTELFIKHLYGLRELYQEIIIVPDGDQAGLDSALKNSLILKKNNFNVKIWNHETKMDPDELIRTQKEIIKNYEKQIVSPINFLLSQYPELRNVEETENFKKKLQPFIQFTSEIEFFYLENALKSKYKLPIEIFDFKKPLIESFKNSSNLITFTPKLIKKKNEAFLWEKYLLYATIKNSNFRNDIQKNDGYFHNIDIQEKWIWLQENNILLNKNFNKKSFLSSIFNLKHQLWFKIFFEKVEEDFVNKKIKIEEIFIDLIKKWEKMAVKKQIEKNNKKIESGEWNLYSEQKKLHKKIKK